MSEGTNYWTRRSISRRAALRGAGLGVAGLAGAALIGCGDDDDDEAAPAAATATAAGAATAAATATATEEAKDQPKPGGNLRYADEAVAPHFSPFHPGVDPSYHNTFRRSTGYYDNLWGNRDTRDPARQQYLRLAESIEQVDDQTVIVKMQRANFHDNPASKKFNSIVGARMLTAEDVAARFAFIAEPPASSNKFVRDDLTVSAVDELTVKFDAARASAFFYDGDGANTRPYEVPQEMLDETVLKEEVPIGTGPYMFKRYQVGSQEEMVRNPDYFVKDRPYIDQRTLTIVPDSAADEAAFRSNQLDRISFQNIRQAESVGRDLGDKIVEFVYPAPSSSAMALLLNVRREPFTDIRFREAIHRSINRQRVIDVVYFGDSELTWVFEPGRSNRFPLGWDGVKDLVGYDPQRAKQLVDAVKADGIYDGRELHFMLPVEAQTWVDAGRLIGEDFEAVGIKVRLEPIVRNIYLQKAGPKPKDANESNDFDITMSVMLGYEHFKSKPGSFWQNANLEDEEIDAIIAQIETTVDAEQRAELSHRFERMMAEKYSVFVPIQAAFIHAAFYADVKGVDFEMSRSGTGGWQLDIWFDQA